MARGRTAMHRHNCYFSALLLGVLGWMTTGSVAGQTSTPSATPNVRALVEQARQAYIRKDFTTADKLYRQAAASADKLLAYERKDLQTQIAQNQHALKTQQEGRALLAKAAAALKAGNRRQARALLRAAEVNQYLAESDRAQLRQLLTALQPASAEGNTAETDSSTKADYATLMAQARKALENNDLATAERLAREAQKVDSNLLPSWARLPWRDSPSRILRDVRAARERLAAQAKKNDEPKQGSAGGMSPLRAVRNFFDIRSRLGLSSQSGEKKTDQPAPQKKESSPTPPPPAPKVSKEDQVRRLLQAGYRALRQNDLQRARAYAERAKAIGARLKGEITPEDLLADIRRHEQKTAGAKKIIGSNKQKGRPTARELLAKGRELLKAGNLEEAEKYCTRAEIAPDAKWNYLVGDNPYKLRADIEAARRKVDQQEASRLIAQAEAALKLGNLKEAKRLAYAAKSKLGGTGLLRRDTRPDRLIARIERMEQSQKTTVQLPSPPGGSSRALPPPPKTDVNPPANTTPTEGMLLKQKAVALLREARQLQQHRKLAEAREKAMQAKALADEAYKRGVAFSPDEDNPSWALRQLAVQALQEIQKLTVEAKNAATAKQDPDAVKRAQQMLQQAESLAKAFQFPIEPLKAQMATLGGNSSRPQPTPSGNTPILTKNQQEGMKRIREAMQYLRAGDTELAYEIAAVAHDPKYGVQEEAAKLLHLIDTEKLKAKIVQANEAADVVRDLYYKGAYKDAWLVAQRIDMKMLTPDRRRRLQEILIQEEMQPSRVRQAKAENPSNPTLDPAGKATISDMEEKGTQTGPAQDEFDRFKAAQKILYAKWAQETLAVQLRAREEMLKGNAAEAIDMLREFRARLAETNLPPEKVTALQRAIERREQQFKVIKAQREWEEKRLAAIRSKSHPERERYLKQQERDQNLKKIISEFNSLYRSGKYEEARLVAKKAKALFPNDETVKMAYEIANIRANKEEFWRIEDEKADFFIRELNMRPGKHLDIRSPVALDKDTIKRARKRNDPTRGFRLRSPSQKELDIERQLETPINVTFKDRPLREALDDLAFLGRVNIVPDDRAIKEMGIDLEQPLSLRLESATLRTALELLLKKVNLTWVIHDNVVEITTRKNAVGKMVQVVYPVADLVIPVVDAPHNAPPSLGDVLRGFPQGQNYLGPRVVTAPYMLPGGRPVSTFSGSQPQTQFGAAGQQMASNGGANGWSRANPRKTIEDQLIKLITTTIGPDTWRDVGGEGTIQYYPLGFGLVVNQTQDIQEQIADLLQALRRLMDLEVAIEIRLIAVSEEFFEFMGVDFNFNITTDQGRFEPQLVTQQFVPGAFVNRFLPDGFMSGLTPAGTFTPDLNIPINPSSFNFTIPQVGGFPGALGANGGIALGLAFLSDIQVFMFMEAAQGDRRANVMQAPRITVFNGQFATLTVFDSIPFLTNIAPVFSVDQLFFVPTQQALPIGTFIFVQPVVSADRRFVRLTINQTMTNLISANLPLVPVIFPVFDQLQDGVVSNQPKIFQVFLQQPQTATITVNTTVTVPDGGTVLLGGLKALTETRSEFGPPVLSKIPYISRIFRNVGYGREASSLMMMVTPRIIINEEEELIFLGQLPPVPRE